MSCVPQPSLKEGAPCHLLLSCPTGIPAHPPDSSPCVEGEVPPLRAEGPPGPMPRFSAWEAEEAAHVAQDFGCNGEVCVSSDTTGFARPEPWAFADARSLQFPGRQPLRLFGEGVSVSSLEEGGTLGQMRSAT